jgi:peroxiredoxin Q/BCP
VWGPKKFQGKDYDGIHRTTFLIDENGKVERVISKVKTKDHAAQILEEI